MPFDNVPMKKPLPLQTEYNVHVLRHARFGIENVGWCKGQFTDEPQSRCVLGWLWFFSPERSYAIATDYLIPVIPVDRGLTASRHPINMLAKFNDHPDTTREDVLNLIDRAIARAEENVDAV